MRVFAPYLERWNLVAEGTPIARRSSRLLPVRYRGQAAMLRVSTPEEERSGTALMQWWDGSGAARVLEHDDGALLMERAEGTRCLATMARNGEDDVACGILCDTALKLHASRSAPQPRDLEPLDVRFSALWPASDRYGGTMRRCAETARFLLVHPEAPIPLHGDLHHGNILDFGSRGWLAIDAVGVLGERGFDYANIFSNPDLDAPTTPVATRPDRFARRLSIVTQTARIERERMVQWIIAWSGLSAAWFLGDGEQQGAEIDLAIAQLALAALDG